MKVYHVPLKTSLPTIGGVYEHVRQLLRFLKAAGVELVSHPHDADLVHVQTAYKPPSPKSIDVFTCHGGFLPSPMLQVVKNLQHATTIITVAEWMIDEFFPQHEGKTVVIPNGVDLAEWEDLPPSGIEPGYVLWAKGFYRPDWLWFQRLANQRPDLRFVSTFGQGCEEATNIRIIGVQSMLKMRSIINDCAVYVSTGSEVCPTMILEAWACGKPVLAWNGDGNAELMRVQHEKRSVSRGGVLYTDFDEMLAGLAHCIDHPEVGDSGRSIVEREYRWGDLVRQVVEVYERCLRK